MSLAPVETLAVALYESECRALSNDAAKRTVLSRIRAHYAFPSWTGLPLGNRQRWRKIAWGMLAEQERATDEDAAWDEVAP